MADEYVTIKIKVNADTKDLKKLNRELLEAGATARLLDKNSSSLSKSLDKNLASSAKKAESRISTLTSALATFNKLALKVFAVTFVVAAASLASVNALFATGRFLVQAYRVTMQALAIGVTAVGAGLAVVAAAQREYNAALYAYAYKASPALGKGMNQSRAALRMLQTDTRLSMFGMEALNASFATLSKSGQVTGKSVAGLRSLADFAAAGGDPAKNLQAAAEFLAIIQREGKLTEDALAAGAKVGDVFAIALKEAKKQGKTSYADLMNFIETSGIKATLGVEGQADLVGKTIMGRLKSYFTQIVGLFADIGQSLLGPVAKEMDRIFGILRMGIIRLAPDFIAFGSGRMLDGLVNAVQKLTDGFVNLTRKYLAPSEGMLKRFSGWWSKVVYVFNRAVDSMRPLLDGGRAVIDIFGPIFSELFGKVGDIIQELDKVIVANRDQWQKFGDAVKDAVTLLGDFISMMITVFDRALPAITPIINAFVQLANAVMRLVEGLSSLPGALGGLDALGAVASMFGLIGVGMAGKNWKAGKGFSPKPGGKTGSKATGTAVVGGTAVGTATGTTIVLPNAIPDKLGPWATQGPFSAFREARKAGNFSMKESLQYANTFRSKGKVGMGTGIAASLALGSIMLPRVDEAAQGLVGLGTTLAGLAPMMGKYGKYGLGAAGGIAGIGTMMKSRTAGGGAISGAIGGASIGAMFGPWGALAGGLIGGAVGWFKGKANAEKIKIEKLVQEKTNELYRSIGEGMLKGDTKSIRENLKKSIADAIKKGQESVAAGDLKDASVQDKFIKNAQNVQKYLTGPLDRYDRVMTTLTQTTSMSEKQIQDLANSLGVNLYDDTITMIDLFKELGVAGRKAVGQLLDEIRDMALESSNIFKQESGVLEATSILDESSQMLAELIESGGATQKDIIDFMSTFFEQLMILNPDKPLAVVQEMSDLFGPGGIAFQSGQVFGGMEAIFGASIGDLLTKQQEQVKTSAIAQLVSTINAGAMDKYGLAFNAEQLTQMLSGSNLQDLQRLTESVDAGTFFGFNKDALKNQMKLYLASIGVLEDMPSLTNIATGVGSAVRSVEDMSDEEKKLRAEFFGIVESGFGDVPNWMKDMPPWWTELGGTPLQPGNSLGLQPTPKQYTGPGPSGTGNKQMYQGGDTATSRLVRTLSKHSSLSGMVGGKQTITSSLRTNNLGSINSDHITGNAYDLIGQNLGSYASLVNGTGGFAEFHGFGGSRHLHVVPGQTPIGDTTLPSMVKSTPVSPSTTNNSYSIVVNGGADSAEKIAKKVMDEITRTARSARERR